MESSSSSAPSSSTSSFEVTLSFQGKTARLANITTETTAQEIQHQAREALSLPSDASLKLLYKGKVLTGQAFPSTPRKPPKILVMATTSQSVSELNAKRSDPTIRGFDQEAAQQQKQQHTLSVWGTAGQDKNYKFCRFDACTWQSFGHRASDTKTPHAFAAMQLLEKLATDPGIVAILKERELVVGTLGEMDPIDDRLKQTKEKQGMCLLGYNTNHGARIDLKLRPDSLEGFLPYHQIASTLIHELSHNWVGEHNLLFWTNFGQMRAEYLHAHASLAASGVLVNGKTTLELAKVNLPNGIASIANVVLAELKREMAQHRLVPDSIAPAILERCQELSLKSGASESGKVVGGHAGNSNTSRNARELALDAAERRARQQEEDKKEKFDKEQ